MKTVERRLDRLEDRLAPEDKKPFLIVVTDAAQKLALDSGTCVQILREAGHLDTTSLSCVVDPLVFVPVTSSRKVPGLDMKKLEPIKHRIVF